MNLFLKVLTLFLFVATSPRAQGNEIDYSHINVRVDSFYDSSRPSIQVGPFSEGLSDPKESVVLETISEMRAQWENLSFLEIYAACIRLYDLGYRDDSIYWFYSALVRGRQFVEFLDKQKMGGVGSKGFQLLDAHDEFAEQIAPYIYGYASGDLDALVSILRRVRSELTSAPQLKKLYPQITFKDDSRWTEINTKLIGELDSTIASIESQKSHIRESRIASGIDQKFSNIRSKKLALP